MCNTLIEKRREEERNEKEDVMSDASGQLALGNLEDECSVKI